MYSSSIIEQRLHRAKERGYKYTRLPRHRCLEIAANLEKLRLDPKGVKMPNGQLIRPLDEKEHEFIRSERLLCAADFPYYFTRYHSMERDPGVGSESGIGPAQMLESQLRFVQLIGRREEVCYAELKKYKRTAGILVYAHKVRQVAITAICRGLSIHRMLFYPGTRVFAATLKEGPEGTGELFKRDKIAIEGLPFWLAPEVETQVKDEEWVFADPLKSRLSYQAENQQTGIGTGTQVDVSHLTEVPLWSYPHRIRYSFLPSLPKAVSTLHIQEGTSAGKGGYWQEVSESCRRKTAGYENYIYIFIPWYTNTTKYVDNAPDTWSPNEHTVKHAELVYRTSPEFCDGRHVTVSRDQLYWWETNRALHARNNETASFLANYPATPEQSFTNWSQGALPVELIEKMEFNLREPHTYSVEVASL